MAYFTTFFIKNIIYTLVVVVGAVEKWNLTTKPLINIPKIVNMIVENSVNNLWKKHIACGAFLQSKDFQQVPQRFHRV
jgi:hypothetical protein